MTLKNDYTDWCHSERLYVVRQVHSMRTPDELLRHTLAACVSAHAVCLPVQWPWYAHVQRKSGYVHIVTFPQCNDGKIEKTEAQIIQIL